MSEFLPPIETLIEQFRRLPGVGRKTATRYAMAILDMPTETADAFAEAITEAKTAIKRCPLCNNLTDGDICYICADTTREKVICVVEDTRALMRIERIRDYRGKFFVLSGVLSPMKGIGPDQLGLDKLMERLQKEDVEEVIVATNPTIEGDTTAAYLMKLIAPTGIKVTRPALGIPVGADIEYADEVTLARALRARNPIT